MPHLHHGAAISSASVLITAMLVFTALVYLRGCLSLRSNSLGGIAGWRVCSFLVGLFLIWLAVASPLSGLDHQSLTVHMLKHLLLMTVAPPLIWLSEPVRAWSQGLPAAFVRIFQRPLMLGLGDFLARPQLGWLAAAAALILWHIPPIFALGMRSAGWHFVEESSFLVTGLLFWWPIIQPWPSISQPDLSMILYLFFATIPCDILSGFLVFCDRVIYPGYLSSSHLFGFTALGDQQCAAALMWTCVTIVYLIAGVILATRLLSPQHVHDRGFVAKSQELPGGREAFQHGD